MNEEEVRENQTPDPNQREKKGKKKKKKKRERKKERKKENLYFTA